MLLLLATLALAGPRIAVADMANRTGDPSLDGAGAGLSGVLVSKLVRVDELEVVERAELGKVLAELDLARSGAIDPTTAAKAGKVLGASHMVLGELVAARLPTLSVNLRVVEVQSGKVVAATDVVGQVGAQGEEFFVLVDQAAFELVELLQVKLGAKDRIELGQVDVKRLGTVDAYGRALTALDRGDKAAAEAALGKALGLEPGFVLAEEALARIATEVVTTRQQYAHAAITAVHTAWDELEKRSPKVLPASPTPDDLARTAVAARMLRVRGDLEGYLAVEAARVAATPTGWTQTDVGKFDTAVRAWVTDGYTASRTMYGLESWPWKVRMQMAEALVVLGQKDKAWAMVLATWQNPGPVLSTTSGPRNPAVWAGAHGLWDLEVLGRRQVLHQAQKLGLEEDSRRALKALDEAVDDAKEARENRAAWDSLQPRFKAGRADARHLDDEERALRAVDDDPSLVLAAYRSFQARLSAGFYSNVLTDSDYTDLCQKYRSLMDGVFRDSWAVDQRLSILLDYHAAVPVRDADDAARRQQSLDDYVNGAYTR